MDALLRTVTQTVAHDVRELVQAPRLEPPVLIEKEPPGFHREWHLPLGFVSLAAAGALLAAAGAVQSRLQQTQHSAPRKIKTRMHKHRVKLVPRRIG
jgi:hypothetical protein